MWMLTTQQRGGAIQTLRDPVVTMTQDDVTKISQTMCVCVCVCLIDTEALHECFSNSYTAYTL